MASFPIHRLLWLGSAAILALAVGHFAYHYVLFTKTLISLRMF
jgi:hypothetical protein